MADKDDDYGEEINPVLLNLRHAKKPSNGLETEFHETEQNSETGEPLQTKKERINILKKIKNDIEINKKKSESQEKSHDTTSLPPQNKKLREKESIMQKLIEVKKKKMEISEHLQGNINQEEDQKKKDDELRKNTEKKTVELSNEKIEKLKNLFSSKIIKNEVEVNHKEEEDDEEEEEEEDNEKNEREKIKQKLLKLALEKKQLKEQATLSLSKKNSNEDEKFNKKKSEEKQFDFNKRDSGLKNNKRDEYDNEEDKDDEDVTIEEKEKEKLDKKALLEKIVLKQKDKQIEQKKDDDNVNKYNYNKDSISPQKNKEDRPEVNKTNELRNIIEMMKNKKKEEEQKREELDEEDKEDDDEEDRREEMKAYQQRIEKEKEEERIRKEKERIKQEEIEREREREKQEKERLEKERLKKEKQEYERLQKERLKRELLEKERLEREEKERHEKERLEREEKERFEKERLEREEKERFKRKLLEKERLEREEKERQEKERLEKERQEKERQEKERQEKERQEKERQEKERIEKERIKREEQIRKEEEEKQRKIIEQQQQEREKQERELKEKLLQEELKQKQFEEERERMKQNEIKLQKEIQQLKEIVKQKQLQDIEYHKEIEFQKQLEKETQKQLEKESQNQSFTIHKTKSLIDNSSYIEDKDYENNEPKGVSKQSHSSKLIYNPKKPGVRGKSVEKAQDISIITTNTKALLNSNCYNLVSNYINDSMNQSDKPLNTNGNNAGYNSSINLLSNYSSFGNNNSSVYSKAPIYNRSPRRYANANHNLSKSPTASYVSSQFSQSQIQYPTQYTQSSSSKRDESELSINLEDLLMLEEKLTDIIISLNTNKQMSNECFEWWNFFYNCSLFNRLEKIYKDDNSRKVIQVSNNIELLSIIICYDVSFDKTSLTQIYIMLKSILNLNHRNFMLICEHILSKISKDSLDNLWVFKLRNVINSNMNKNSNENFNKYFDSPNNGSKYIDEIKYNSSCISDYLRIILKNYQNSKVIESLVILFKNIQKKTYEEINLFFREKIMRVENRNASVLASVLIRDNFKFLSVPTPYLKKPNLKKYTLVLDLDETLIHFKVNPNDDSQGVLLERPGILDFLETVGYYYELIIFTAAIQDYADPIINAIEEKRLYFDYRLYRQHAVIIDNDFVKDLTRLGRPNDKMIIVDNMPQNFRLQKENGIFIRAFWGEDQYDTALIDLMPILINIAQEGGDVRHGLSKYREEIVRKVSSNISKNNK